MDKLFEPGFIGRLEVKNRIVFPPMVTDFGNPDGTVSDAQIAYYARRARGGAGLIEVEATAIDSRHLLSAKQLCIDEDAYIPRLNALARAIKAGGAKAAIQIVHPGRQLLSSQAKETPVGPSPIPLPLPGYLTPRELSRQEIKGLVERFAQGARRAKLAGFDAVEIHGAHSYLLCQFLSPFSNYRQDEYGGSLPGRARFLLEVLEAVRGEVGRDFPVLVRLSATEFVEGGLSLEDSCAIAQMAEQAGANAISVSAGNRLTSYRSVQPVLIPKGCLVPLGEAVHRTVKVPVMVAGRINDPDQAEEILQAGKVDFVAMGRALLADPDLPNKAQQGRKEQVRHCIACMSCSQTRGKGWLACLVNPETGREEEKETAAPTSQRVLVLDGGAAGLEAARVAALRGHQVTLWSHSPHPEARWTWLIRAYYHQQLKELKSLGVKVELGKDFSAHTVAEFRPQAVVASPEQKPVMPQVPGVHQDNVALADAALGGAPVGQRVAVIGGGSGGLEVAFFLARRGKQVTILETSQRLGQGLEERTARLAEEQLRQQGVAIHIGADWRGLQGSRLTFVTSSGDSQTLTVDSVVIALGYQADYRLLDELQERGLAVHRVGASASPAAAYELAQRGAAVARQI